MPMPRVTSGTVPSASAFNTVAQEIDNLGVSCKVRRTAAQTAIPGTTDLVINWQAVTFDTRGDMWDPAFPSYVTIQIEGTYILTLQERFSASGGSDHGQRAAKIMVNGTSVFANSIASDKRAGDVSVSEGVTLLMVAVSRLYVGDQIYCNYWSSHNANNGPATITGLNTDLGGTYLSVSRLAPVAI